MGACAVPLPDKLTYSVSSSGSLPAMVIVPENAVSSSGEKVTTNDSESPASTSALPGLTVKLAVQ